MSPDDKKNRLEIHCTSCGALLKAKLKYAGRSLRCPKCQASNTVPFTLDDRGKIVAKSGPGAGPSGPDGGIGGIAPLGIDTASAPMVKQIRHIPELDSALRSIQRCFEDAFDRGQGVLTDVGLNREKKEAELMQVRRDLATSMKNVLVNGLKGLQERTLALKTHPMAESLAIKEKLEETEAALDYYRIFAKCMFDLKA